MRYTLLFIVLVGYAQLGYTQSCGENGFIFLRSQADVDNFSIDYPNCTTIERTLIIEGMIYNLDGLEQITAVNGSVEIQSYYLTSLHGLHNLSSVGSSYAIYDCPSLTNIDALSNLSEIYHLALNNCGVTNLQALSNATTVTNRLVLQNNAQLTDFQGLENLVNIEGGLILGGGAITSLNGLQNLVSAGSLYLNNTNLSSLLGLENLTHLSESLSFYHNSSLLNLNGIEALNYIGEKLEFYNNANLTSLEGLNSLQTIDGGGIMYGDVVRIELNHSLLNLDGLINLETINNGSLTIENNNSLQNLEGLNNLSFIFNDLKISKNPVLQIENGFPELEEVGDITITDNNQLVHLSGFNALHSSGWVTIKNNPELQTITEFNGEFDSIDVHIANNDHLQNIDIFNNALSIRLIVSTNEMLQSIKAAPNAIGSVNLIIRNNPSLINLHPYTGTNVSVFNFTFDNNDAFVQLDILDLFPNTTLFSNFIIEGNNLLTNILNIGAIENLHRLIIKDNLILESIGDFDSLETIGYQLNISGNSEITNLNGLSNLTSIGPINYNPPGGIDINNNASLNDISGMSNLIDIRGNLKIKGNNVLSTLEGIENINPTSISSITIQENPFLEVCNVESICTFLEERLGPYTIFGNAPRCESAYVVAESCGFILDVDTNKFLSFNIYPNPTEGILNFNETLQNEIIIFNQLGQKVLSQQGNSSYIDLTQLENGLYYLQLEDQNGPRFIRKVIKK